MFSRRVATFLLGMWIGCCLFADILALRGSATVDRILNNPQSAEAMAAVEQAGGREAGGLLRHTIQEQVRAMLNAWGAVQLLLGLSIGVLLVVTDQRKPLAIGLCAAMTAVAAVQHYFFTPELEYQGRLLDFRSESEAFQTAARLWTLRQMFGGAELFKLLLGGVLASYLFAVEAVVRRSRRREPSKEADVFTALGKPS